MPAFLTDLTLTSPVTIGIIVVILIVAGGLFYAKKENIWPFDQ